MADCDNCRDGDCPRCDIFTCSCLHNPMRALTLSLMDRGTDDS